MRIEILCSNEILVARNPSLYLRWESLIWIRYGNSVEERDSYHMPCILTHGLLLPAGFADSLLLPYCRFSVLREKKILELPVAKLVVGDILKFKCDDTLPVDGILVQVKRERGREGVWVCVKAEDRWVMANVSHKAGQTRLTCQ